jgi:SAM-dependent methyltransferase
VVEPGEPSWRAPDVVADYATEGYTDPGERTALAAVRDWWSGRVADLGVGGGRTTGLLAERARPYLGVDVAPEMLDLARERWPTAFLIRGDARDLHALPDAGFDLVVFSFNGLDSLDRPGRAAALAEMARVVAPTGRVVFSSLNRDGVSFDERPWRFRGWFHLLLALRHPRATLRGFGHYRRTRAGSEDGDGWARRPMRAHEFRFVVHFATLADVVGSATAAGLEVLEAWADDGRSLDVGAATTDADYVHLVCRPSDAPRDL